MWVIASDYRVVFSEDIRDASIAAPAAGAGVLSIRDASSAASAAASGVLGRLDTQTTEDEETVLEVQSSENRELSVQHATVEATYFVRLREHCFAVAEWYATEMEMLQALYEYFR